MGIVNFQRKSIPRFSEVAKPLSRDTGGQSSKTIDWTLEMQIIFEDLKNEAVKDIELAYPEYFDRAEPLELYLDAFGYGVGACLVQKQDGRTRVIGYAYTSFFLFNRYIQPPRKELQLSDGELK